MTEDGHIYSMGNITQWLNKKDTSPNTNNLLKHKRVMRLLSLSAVMQNFLSQCRVERSAARAQCETKARRSCESATRYDHMQTEMDKLEGYITECKRELDAWNAHIGNIFGIRDALAERLQMHRRMAARIQSSWRSFSA
jgi:hypothetical protein